MKCNEEPLSEKNLHWLSGYYPEGSNVAFPSKLNFERVMVMCLCYRWVGGATFSNSYYRHTGLLVDLFF